MKRRGGTTTPSEHSSTFYVTLWENSYSHLREKGEYPASSLRTRLKGARVPLGNPPRPIASADFQRSWPVCKVLHDPFLYQLYDSIPGTSKVWDKRDLFYRYLELVLVAT